MENITSTKEKSHQIVSWILITALLLLRLPFFGGVLLVVKQRSDIPTPSWLVPVFEIGTYFLTACLIIWERERLSDFSIDRLAIGIIILFKPVQTIILCIWKVNDNPLAFPNWPSIIIWIIAIGLALTLWLTHPHIPKFSKASFRWFGIGMLIGFLITILWGYPMSFQVGEYPHVGTKTLVQAAIQGALWSFLYQLGFAAVSEEPLFRGFLWGHLEKARWKKIWINLFQTALFMLGHIYYITKLPISFWFIVPTAALLFGALIWRSKTISSSMAAHAVSNTFGRAVGIIIDSLKS